MHTVMHGRGEDEGSRAAPPCHRLCADTRARHSTRGAGGARDREIIVKALGKKHAMARRPGAGWPSAEGARRCADRCAAETTRHALEAERAGSAPLASATQAAFLADSSSRASRTTMPLEIPPTTVFRLEASSPAAILPPCLAQLFSVYFCPQTRTDGASERRNRHAHQAACHSPRALMRMNLRFKWPKRVAPPVNAPEQSRRRTWRMACSSSCSTS